MRYAVEVEPLVPFSGPPLALAIKAALTRLMGGVAAEAERRAAGSG